MQTPGKLFTLTKFVGNPSVNQANIVFQCFFLSWKLKLQENQGVCYAILPAILGLLHEFIIHKLLIKRKHGHLFIDQLAKHQGTRLWKYVHFEFIQKVDQFLPIAPRNKLFWYTRKMKGEMK